jgi:hypothetical protein
MMSREVGHHDVGVHPRPGGKGEAGYTHRELCHLVEEEQCRHLKSHSVIQWVRRRRCGFDFFLLSFLFVRFIRRYFSTRFFHIFPRFPDKNFPFAIRFEPLWNWILRV